MRFIHIVSGDAARAGETPLGSASDDEVIDEPLRGNSPSSPPSTITSSPPSATHKESMQLGCRHFIIHARKCLLEGLSVKENRSIPPLHYDWVFRLLDDFPALDFSLNGGVVNLGVAQELLDRRSAGGRQLRGVMIGRMLSKAPWLLHYVDQFFYGEPNPPCDRYEAIMKYVDFCEEMQRGECRGLGRLTRSRACLQPQRVPEAALQCVCQYTGRRSLPPRDLPRREQRQVAPRGRGARTEVRLERPAPRQGGGRHCAHLRIRGSERLVALCVQQTGHAFRRRFSSGAFSFSRL